MSISRCAHAYEVTAVGAKTTPLLVEGCLWTLQLGRAFLDSLTFPYLIVLNVDILQLIQPPTRFYIFPCLPL
jgi:hypothetical protein